MKGNLLGQRILSKVVQKLGGLDRTSASLHIPKKALEDYLEGARDVPDAILLRAIDLVLEDA